MLMGHITEKQLENFICKHPEYSLWQDVEIIGRQITVEHGRLDILAWDGRVLVIELKARALEEKDVGQVLRYKRDVEAEFNRWGAFEHPNGGEWPRALRLDAYADLWSHYYGLSQDSEPAVIPVLIGSSIEQNVHAAAEGGGIEVILWKYDRGQNALDFTSPKWLTWRDGPYPKWCWTLFDRIHNLCMQEADKLFDEIVDELFKVNTEDHDGQLSGRN